MGPRAGLDRCRKSRPYRDSIPGPSNLSSVVILTELPGPHEGKYVNKKGDGREGSLTVTLPQGYLLLTLNETAQMP